MRVEITTHYEWNWLISHGVPSAESGCFVQDEIRLSKSDLILCWIIVQMCIADNHHFFGLIVAEADQHGLVVSSVACAFVEVCDVV